MSSSQWPGLVTNASPFAIPATAAVDQVNLASDVPGQVYVRGGMRKVAVVGGSPDLLDCFPYEQDGKSTLISMLPDGRLVFQQSPAYGWQAQVALEPNLSSPGIVSTSYTQRFAEGGIDEEVFPEPDQDPSPGGGGPPPEEEPCNAAFNGGTASTFVASPRLAAEGCPDQAQDIEFSGGTASATADCSDAPPDPCDDDGDGPQPPQPPNPNDPPLAVPSAPQSVSVQFIASGATVSWSPPSSDGGSRVLDYDMEISTTGGASPSPLPGTPSIPIVTAWGATSATVVTFLSGSLSAPAVPAGVVMELERQSSTNGGSTWLNVGTGPLSQQNATFFVTGLTAGTQYRFRSRARNFVGYGPYSQWSISGTPTGGTPPSPATPEPIQVEVVLTPVIQQQSDSGSLQWAHSRLTGVATADGLLTGVSYTWQGRWLRTLTPAGCLGGVGASCRWSTSATAAWQTISAPSQFGTGSSPSDFYYRQNPNDVQSLRAVYYINNNTGTKPFPSHYWEVRLRVTGTLTRNGSVLGTAEGFSRVIPFSEYFGWGYDYPTDIAASTPGAPTITAALETGDGKLIASWTPPANDGGSAITGYKLYVSDVFKQQVSATPTSNRNLGEVDNAYAGAPLRISAVNAAGEGPKSAVFTITS